MHLGEGQNENQEGIVPNSEIEDLLDRIARLSDKERQKLTEHLNKEKEAPGVNVILGNGHNYSYDAKMVIQISLGDEELARELVTALSQQIRNANL